ncbi:hypothetical protein c7_R37 [Megavirus courdo7]|uniref:Uncharacterized protein n=1 Tax=Megavirus courdo7 TaxID=1128135 RepID=H2E9N0_9VIRU|nr:hypothetical protein c7_R37 [Megavirus courdo7]
MYKMIINLYYYDNYDNK